ncbi:ACT domain-containing protein [Clostridiaceae bacterium]|jgi:ACT domain-containing protein|nr:ACT domain-containing protein [Clostridium sp.]NBI72080.1 ACT domain-containing protein [Clostridiaceae bacterium]
MSKIIITIVGKDRVGIVAKTCSYLADNQMNILDITQTILQDYFNMMMIVDISRAEKSFDDMARELSEVGDAIGVTIRCQREEIFTSMHRI